ncbi:hypothetical protein ACLOJK_002810 [Asimina triloba]
MASAAGSNAAAPFWRAAGMTYVTYSNLCASLVRNCLKEPYKSEALNREKVHFSVSKWTDGKASKPRVMDISFKELNSSRGCLVPEDLGWIEHLDRVD